MLIFQSSYFYPLTPVYMPTRASMPTSVITSTFPNSASTVTQLVVFHYFFLLSPSNNVLECFPVTLNFFFLAFIGQFLLHSHRPAFTLSLSHSHSFNFVLSLLTLSFFFFFQFFPRIAFIFSSTFFFLPSLCFRLFNLRE